MGRAAAARQTRDPRCTHTEGTQHEPRFTAHTTPRNVSRLLLDFLYFPYFLYIFYFFYFFYFFLEACFLLASFSTLHLFLRAPLVQLISQLLLVARWG